MPQAESFPQLQSYPFAPTTLTPPTPSWDVVNQLTNQVKYLTEEVERGNKERATFKEALAISLSSHAVDSARESPRVLRLAPDTTHATKTLVRDKESPTTFVTRIREDVQDAHSSNKDEEQHGNKAKKTLALDTTTRQTEKTLSSQLAKIKALELAVEELEKGKMPAKRSSLPNPLSAEIQGEAIPITLKILMKEYNVTTDLNDHSTYFTTSMNSDNASDAAKCKAFPTTF